MRIKHIQYDTIHIQCIHVYGYIATCSIHTISYTIQHACSCRNRSTVLIILQLYIDPVELAGCSGGGGGGYNVRLATDMFTLRPLKTINMRRNTV